MRLRHRHAREITHTAVFIAIGEIGLRRYILGVHPTVLGAMNRADKSREYDHYYIERWDADATQPAARWVYEGEKWELIELTVPGDVGHTGSDTEPEGDT